MWLVMTCHVAHPSLPSLTRWTAILFTRSATHNQANQTNLTHLPRFCLPASGRASGCGQPWHWDAKPLGASARNDQSVSPRGAGRRGCHLHAYGHLWRPWHCAWNCCSVYRNTQCTGSPHLPRLAMVLTPLCACECAAVQARVDNLLAWLSSVHAGNLPRRPGSTPE